MDKLKSEIYNEHYLYEEVPIVFGVNKRCYYVCRHCGSEGAWYVEHNWGYEHGMGGDTDMMMPCSCINKKEKNFQELYAVICNTELDGQQFCNDAKTGNLLFYWTHREAQWKASDINREHQSSCFVVQKIVLGNVTNINNRTQIKSC